MVGENKLNFEKKDITVKKVDNSFVRGICLAYDNSGVILEVKGSNRIVFIPKHQISEIFTERRVENERDNHS